MKKYMGLLVFGIVIIVMCLVLTNIVMKSEESREKGDVDNYAVDEQVVSGLIDESTNVELEKKVLGIINNNMLYDIQEEIECNGLVYKRIQLNSLEYTTASDMLYDYYSKDDELKQIFDKELQEDRIVDFGPERESFYELTYVVGAPSIKKPEIGQHMEFRKGENFGFIEEFAISALVCYNKQNEVVDVLAFQGASGLDIEVIDGKVKWEVFLIQQVDYYYKGNVLKSEPNRVYGEGFCTGVVYDMYIDRNNNIEQVVKNRESTDNNYYFLSPPYVDCVHAYKGVYIKNYNISIKDVIDWGSLESTKELLSKSTEEIQTLIREEFGKETIAYMGDDSWCLYYATKEGYIVRIGPQTITEDGIKREELITYLNITASEFLDLDKKGEYVHNNIQSLFIKNDINPEILKEIRLDG